MYAYSDVLPTWSNGYLWPIVKRILAERKWPDRRAFDLGCGNGATANMLSEHGFQVTAIDSSTDGVGLAKAAFPHVRTELGDAYDDLAGRYGTFPLVVSLEVVEHCMQPRRFAKTFRGLLAPGGTGIISTPYHGYAKNLALSIAGKWDVHLNPLWDGGHIKFFSIRSMRSLLEEAGLSPLRFERAGRIPLFAKSMVAVIRG
jgi:2-polyprenyl-6-hydroxyphenyl methylase/3-demethylubiquinone-9 3-methyltransferase